MNTPTGGHESVWIIDHRLACQGHSSLQWHRVTYTNENNPFVRYQEWQQVLGSPGSLAVARMDSRSPTPSGLEGAGSALSTCSPVSGMLFSLSPLLLPPSPSPHAVFVYRNEPCVAAAAFYDCFTHTESSGSFVK